jgi:hypothetical protein
LWARKIIGDLNRENSWEVGADSTRSGGFVGAKTIKFGDQRRRTKKGLSEKWGKMGPFDWGSERKLYYSVFLFSKKAT